MSRSEASYVWLNGEIVPWNHAQFSLLTHSLHYGLGAFEGIRAYEQADGSTAVFRLSEHVARLQASCRILQLDLPYSAEDLVEGCRRIVEVNGFISCYLRPIVFLGEGSMGVLPRKNPVVSAIAAWNWGAYLGEEGLTRGIRCQVSSYVRQFPNSGMNKAKATGGYITSILAKREAVANGYDESILLDTAGFVAEGTGENLFIVRDGVLMTPPPLAILEGITRASIIEMAHESGIEVRERNLTRDELYTADEVFLSGTAAEITPVREVDGRTVGAGRMGPMTESLQQRFFDIVTGKEPAFAHWRTSVASAQEVGSG